MFTFSFDILTIQNDHLFYAKHALELVCVFFEVSRRLLQGA